MTPSMGPLHRRGGRDFLPRYPATYPTLAHQETGASTECVVHPSRQGVAAHRDGGMQGCAPPPPPPCLGIGPGGGTRAPSTADQSLTRWRSLCRMTTRWHAYRPSSSHRIRNSPGWRMSFAAQPAIVAVHFAEGGVAPAAYIRRVRIVPVD